MDNSKDVSRKCVRWKRLLALLILLVSVWVCYWAHRLKTGGVVDTTHNSCFYSRHSASLMTWSRINGSRINGSLQARQPLLWKSVGCDSKYPILACQKRGQARRTDQSENCIGANKRDFDTHPILQRRWKSCAVVGSSGSLLLRDRGKEIDEHEIVARINYPPVKGYEKHVGCRPGDIQFWGDKITRCYKESTDSTLIVSPLPSGWRVRSISRSFCERNAKMEMFSISNYIFDTGLKMVYDFSRKQPLLEKKGSVIHRFPTAGLRAILFCLLICDSVDAYGFGIDQRTPYHYFEKGSVSADSLGAHYWNAELEILKTWPNTTHPSQFGRLTWIP